MDDKLAQAPANAAYARPQQPTDSPVAALPVETLQHILQLARQESSPPDAARTLKSFSRVCKLWYDVAQQEGRGELFVANSKQAERLTRALLDSSTRVWQRSIRAVAIQVERGGGSASKSQRVGNLILQLPRLKHLYLELQESLTDSASQHRPLGYHLCLALRKIITLTHFQLELGVSAALVRCPVTALLSMISCWPNLVSFTAPTLECREDTSSGGLFLTPTIQLSARLQQITIGTFTRIIGGVIYQNINSMLLAHLLANSTHTVQSLNLGPFHEDVLLETAGCQGGTNLGAMLEEAAPHLRHLDLRDGPRPFLATTPQRADHLVNIISRLTSIRALTLGLGGVPYDQLFLLLGRLRTLVDLSLVSNENSPSPTTYVLDAQAAIAFISESEKLRSIQLPLSYCGRWSAGERKAVESEAEAAGVRLGFA